MNLTPPKTIQLDRARILHWLQTEDSSELTELWSAADATRAQNVGDDVHLRGIVEIGNICSRHCHYCGLRANIANFNDSS